MDIGDMNKGIPMRPGHGRINFRNNYLRTFNCSFRVINGNPEAAKSTAIRGRNGDHGDVHGNDLSKKGGNLVEEAWDIISPIVPNGLPGRSTGKKGNMSET